MSLWAAKRIMSQSTNSPYAFTRYCDEHNCKTNSASGGLNKWLKEHISSDAVIHGYGAGYSLEVKHKWLKQATKVT